jgi:hypothetical protein
MDEFLGATVAAKCLLKEQSIPLGTAFSVSKPPEFTPTTDDIRHARYRSIPFRAQAAAVFSRGVVDGI